MSDELESYFFVNEDFWAAPLRRNDLFAAVVAVTKATSINFSRFYDMCEALVARGVDRGVNHDLRYPTRERFHKHLTEAAKGVNVGGFRAHRKEPGRLDPRFYNAMAICCRRTIERQGIKAEGEWKKTVDAFFAAADKAREDKATSPAAQMVAAILFGGEHNLPEHPIPLATQRFFGSRHNLGAQLFFETYRFSRKAGHIDKSFTVIVAPLENFDATQFLNYFSVGGDEIRKTSGIAIGLHAATYLLGPSSRAESLKMITLPHVDTAKIKLSGGTMSTDNDGSVVMGRILLVRTPADHSDKLEAINRKPIGNYVSSELASELKASDLNLIRNQSEMTIEGDLLEWQDDGYKHIDQSLMVAHTRQILKISPNGKDRFALSDGKKQEPFNPADKKHYTFNGAISIG